MNWSELIDTFDAQVILFEPAVPREIREVEQALGVLLPGELRSLLGETNGLSVKVYFPGEEDAVEFSVICSTQEILLENKNLHNVPATDDSLEPLASFLFFGTEPDGDPVGFPIVNGIVQETALVRMFHEDFRERKVRYASLREFVTQFLEFASEYRPKASA